MLENKSKDPENQISVIFFQNLRIARRELRLSQSQIAAMVGLSRPYFNRIEKECRDISINLANRLSIAVGVELSELLRRRVDKN